MTRRDSASDEGAREGYPCELAIAVQIHRFPARNIGIRVDESVARPYKEHDCRSRGSSNIAIAVGEPMIDPPVRYPSILIAYYAT